MSKDMLKNYFARHLEERKDARKRFGRSQPIVADCKTMDAAFKATIQDVSSAGVFLKTDRNLQIGQEIAMTFKFPYTGEFVRATGEVARITHDGAGVAIKLFFKE